MNTEEAVLNYINTRRWARGTTKGSTYTLAQFVDATGNPPVDELTARHCQEWWSTRTHLAASTARSRRSTVSNFLRWCRHSDLLQGDPLASIPVPREPRRMPVTLTDDDVAALMQVVPDARAEAVVTLMYWLGLRCVDVANMQIGDADLRARMLLVHGKGGHEDMLPLPERVCASLRRYLNRFPAPAGPMFRTYSTPPRGLSAQHISESVGAWLRDCGVKRSRHDGIGAHALRRTCATDLLDSGANLRQVQAVLRHESLATTQRYLRRADAEELRGILERDIA